MDLFLRKPLRSRSVLYFPKHKVYKWSGVGSIAVGGNCVVVLQLVGIHHVFIGLLHYFTIMTVLYVKWARCLPNRGTLLAHHGQRACPSWAESVSDVCPIS